MRRYCLFYRAGLVMQILGWAGFVLFFGYHLFLESEWSGSSLSRTDFTLAGCMAGAAAILMTRPADRLLCDLTGRTVRQWIRYGPPPASGSRVWIEKSEGGFIWTDESLKAAVGLRYGSDVGRGTIREVRDDDSILVEWD